MAVPRFVAGVLAVTAIGCTGNSPTAPNPFNSADRVAPPAPQVPAAGGAPYYQGAPALPPAAPSFGQPAAAPGFAPAPAGAFPPVTPAPGAAAPVYAPTGPQGSASRGLPPTNQLTQGDSIAVPSDNSSMRFRSPTIDPSSAPARNSSAALASNAPATASGWIAGSAPVSSSASAAPRVRMPGEALPTEPLRVASPPESTTGWR